MDTRLTMDGRSSPGIFNSLPGAMKWIINKVYEIPRLCHFLDGIFKLLIGCPAVIFWP